MAFAVAKTAHAVGVHGTGPDAAIVIDRSLPLNVTCCGVGCIDRAVQGADKHCATRHGGARPHRAVKTSSPAARAIGAHGVKDLVIAAYVDSAAGHHRASIPGVTC